MREASSSRYRKSLWQRDCRYPQRQTRPRKTNKQTKKPRQRDKNLWLMWRWWRKKETIKKKTRKPWLNTKSLTMARCQDKSTHTKRSKRLFDFQLYCCYLPDVCTRCPNYFYYYKHHYYASWCAERGKKKKKKGREAQERGEAKDNVLHRKRRESKKKKKKSVFNSIAKVVEERCRLHRVRCRLCYDVPNFVRHLAQKRKLQWKKARLYWEQERMAKKRRKAVNIFVPVWVRVL